MYTTRVFYCFTGRKRMQGGAAGWNGTDARQRGGLEGNEGKAPGEV